MPAIEVRCLTIRYPGSLASQRIAVSDLAFRVEPRQIVGFVGPNGAGKTSAIKALLNLIPVPPGRCFVSGMPSCDPQARARLGYMPESSYYPRYLKLSEFLHVCATVSGMPRVQRYEAVRTAAERTGLSAHLEARLSTFSKGMLQQAGFAQALVHDPDILVLDEPMSGLDPIARVQMRELLSTLRSEGKTILFSSHELGEIEMVADRILVLCEGRLVYEGTVPEIVDKVGSLERAFIRLLQGDLPWAA